MDLGGSPKMEGQKVTSRKYYEMELQKLNASLLEMGEMIRMAIDGAVTALLEFDHDKAREIIAYDEQIDRQNREIEQQCYTLLLSQQPVAGDLRMVSAALKMTTDMERIGDHAAAQQADVHALIIDVFAHQPDVARDFAALHQIVHPVQTL